VNPLAEMTGIESARKSSVGRRVSRLAGHAAGVAVGWSITAIVPASRATHGTAATLDETKANFARGLGEGGRMRLKLFFINEHPSEAIETLPDPTHQ
jgi:hypothetical protein